MPRSFAFIVQVALNRTRIVYLRQTRRAQARVRPMKGFGSDAQDGQRYICPKERGYSGVGTSPARAKMGSVS